MAVHVKHWAVEISVDDDGTRTVHVDALLSSAAEADDLVSTLLHAKLLHFGDNELRPSPPMSKLQ